MWLINAESVLTSQKGPCFWDGVQNDVDGTPSPCCQDGISLESQTKQDPQYLSGSNLTRSDCRNPTEVSLSLLGCVPSGKKAIHMHFVLAQNNSSTSLAPLMSYSMLQAACFAACGFKSKDALSNKKSQKGSTGVGKLGAYPSCVLMV